MDTNKSKQTPIVKLICLLLSVGLWLYVTNVENPIKTYEISAVPVELQNEDVLESNKLALVPEAKYTIDLKIEGKASDIYKVSKDDFKVVADLGAYALKKGENNIPIQIIKSPDNVSIKNNTFLGIRVNIEDLVTKDLKVISKVNIGYKDGIYELEKTISPESIKVTGAASTVSKVVEIAMVGEKTSVDSDFTESFELKAFDKDGKEVTGVNLSEKRADLSVKISNGKTVDVKLKTVGQISGGIKLENIELSLNKVQIMANKDILDKISYIETEAIDLSSITQDTNYDLKLVLPQGVRLIDNNGFVKAKVKIAQDIITKEVSVPVKYNEAGFDTTKYSLGDHDANITIKLTGRSDEINNLKIENIIAEIKLEGKKEGEYKDQLPVVTIQGNNGSISVAVVNKINYKIILKQ